MANHQSSEKRIRQTEKRRLHNRYYAKTARNAVRKLRAMTEKETAADLLPKVSAMSMCRLILRNYFSRFFYCKKIATLPVVKKKL